MRITFENTPHQNVDKVTNSYSAAGAGHNSKTGGVKADISGMVTDNSAYGVQGRTAEEVMQEAGLIDTTQQKNYMTVMSNSMSSEDYAKMLKDGYHPEDMEIEDVVTIVDTIKAELAKSGTEIIGYTDDLDNDTLLQLTGSQVWANQIKQTFHQKDVPLTEENVTKTVEALKQALQLEAPTEGEMKYMVSNEMEPTIENLYKAQFSGAYDANRQGKGYYADELPGYYSKKAEDIDIVQLLPQIEKIIEEAGLLVNEESLSDARWIIEKGLPLTADNLKLLAQNKEVQLPSDSQTVVDAIAVAITEGKEPESANLTETKSKYEKAVEMVAYLETLELDNSVEITARRQLEEIRLAMTTVANLKLVESDFSIDTTDLEATVEALKEAEKQWAEKLFPNQDQDTAVKSAKLYKETLAVTQQIPQLPISTIGKLINQSLQECNIQQVYTQGKELQAVYEEANLRYETMMSTPRADLGDSIQKAFRNTDAILEDLGMEITGENRRAIRILGYNNTQINQENLLAVKEADLTVQRVVEQMTPAATLKMIRDGMNPLETDMDTLMNYFKEIHSEPYYEMEKYSTYLQKMEQNGEITQEERESYIGVYRMLRQIEKTDGAVIGSVLQAGSELSFSNLLTAVRSAKKAGMNILIDDDFGALTEDSVNEQKNITQQINSALHNEETVHLLNQNDVPVTMNNLMAAQALTYEAGSLFKNIRKQSGEDKKIEELTEELSEAFTDAEHAKSAYQEFELSLNEIIKNAVWETNETSSIDVKKMQSAFKQLSIAAKMAERETYEMPLVIDDEVTALRITFVHKREGNSSAVITAQTEKYGALNVNMELAEKQVSGYMTSEKEEGNRFKGFMEIYQNNLQSENLNLQNFYYIQGNQTIKHTEKSEEVKNAQTRDIYQAVKLFMTSIQQYSKSVDAQ